MADDSTQPPNATRFVETTQGILSYTELAPLLAERVLKIQQDIEDSVFGALALDTVFLLRLHHAICADLTPAWAGKLRSIDVRVGSHVPPVPHRLAELMHAYCEDLNARMKHFRGQGDELLLECLAFAEGRLLSIHPFADFNGRVTRLFLAEFMRRNDLPSVELTPSEPATRTEYIAALRAADGLDWMPLVDIWRVRLERAL